MTDWQDVLQQALRHGDPLEMKAALGAVPASVLHAAVPVFSRMAGDCVRDGRLEEALVYLDQLVELEPDDGRWRLQRAGVNMKLDRPEAVVVDAEHLTALRPEEVDGHRLLAEAHDGLRNRREALEAYRRLRELVADDAKLDERIAYLDGELRKEELLQRVLDPEADTGAATAPALPRIEFDPAIQLDPAPPDTVNPAMLAGLKQHLSRYGDHQSSRAALERLEDERWLQAWDEALTVVSGGRVLLYGSELGTLAVRALAHGASHVTIVEPSPIDARIASGILQKHLLAGWHEHHGAAVQEMTEEARRDSFTAYADHVTILSPDAEELREASFDWLLVPNIDHALLGTGIVSIIDRFRRGAANPPRVLPAKARLHAVGIQWEYPGVGYDLQDVSALRWSPYPQAVDLPDACWTALTGTVEIGEIDLVDFAAAKWTRELDVIAAGRLDAILFWFDIEIGPARLDTGPGGGLRCLRPAAQYTDPIALAPGSALPLRVHVDATRVHFETVPAAATLRSGTLPSWYVPMIVDAPRNAAYRDALASRLAGRDDAVVLDIGAGCGLLSLMAADAGASMVFGCEVDPSLARLAGEVVARNGAAERVRIIAKDSRRISIPEDMATRADLAVFELFDCSLIGEGVLHFLAHAREHLLAPNALLVPMAGRVRGMVVEYRLDRIRDVDVNILNPYRFSAEFINVDADALNCRPLSEPFDVFSFDFADAAPTPETREIDAVVTAAGTAGALLFWFDLQLAPERWLSNAPAFVQGAGGRLHWKQALQFLPEVSIETGSALPLTARHNGSAMAFRWRQDALPAEVFSKLPRFDPRVFQQASELQEQTANLFRHCMSDPAEYRRVAELAQRFAVDPASYGLDPRIAQRFVARFFANGS
jgi:protein arginine N-methyltransferase 7